MSSEKLSRKEIREPDKFLKITTDFWNKAAQHEAKIGIGIVAVIAIFLVAWAVTHSISKKADAAGGALASALELSRRGVEGSLDLSGDAEPDAPKFASEGDKFTQIATALEKVRSEHSGSLAARTAAFYLADAQYQLGKLDDADKSYQEFIREVGSGDPLRVLALEGRGYVAEGKKDLATAGQLFDQMSQEAAGDPLKARAAFHKARILVAEGKKQEAAEAFQKLKDDFKETPAARQASERLALLAAEGVRPAPKAADAQAGAEKK